MTDSAATPDQTTSSSAATPDELQAALAERDDFKEKWARSQADLQNYRKRMQREMEEDRKFAVVPLVKAMLPGLDNLQRALQAASASKSVDELVTGVEMVVKQLEAAFIAAGVQPIIAEGQPFDPNRHEAISQMPSADVPPMTVLNDVERGYVLNDRVIRPTKVIVSSTPPA
ncbi:MAG TPA: nucleotide exchange factor GrpE [Planctomycetaceae bacterium]|nr:nucleotide exchange factor GrpE [Planctomycetaceae bacterium]